MEVGLRESGFAEKLFEQLRTRVVPKQRRLKSHRNLEDGVAE